jgi:hypothetical protein
MAKARRRERRNVTPLTLVRRAVCVVLILLQMGCRSVYRFHCTSYPTGTAVTVAEEQVGMTSCDVEVPKDSAWIQDGKVAFTFYLPDEKVTPERSRQKTRVVDLSGLRPSNPVAEFVSSPFFLTGVGLLFLAGESLKDEDANAKDKEKGLTWGIFGIAVLAVGAGVYALSGGDSKSMSHTEVRVNFDESEAPVTQP